MTGTMPALTPEQMKNFVDLDAERACIGALLGSLANSQCVSVVAAIVEPEMFTDEVYRDTARIILARHNEGEPVDIDYVVLTAKANDAGYPKVAAGMKQLIAAAEATPGTRNLERYAKRVREMHCRRDAASTICKAWDAITHTGGWDTGFFAELGNWIDRLSTISDNRAADETSHISALLPDADRTERRIARTGVTWIDQSIGLAFGEYVILAGRPSMGKSSLANQLATAVAKQGHGVAIFSQEMDPEQWLTNSIAREAQIDGQLIRSGSLDPEQRQQFEDAKRRLETLPIHFMRRSSRSVASVVSESTRLHASESVELIVVDYIQNIPSGKRHQSENDALTYISRTLQTLSRDLGLCVVAVSQLSRGDTPDRGVKTPAPGLNRLRGSGSIEQDADVAIFVHRPEYYALVKGESPGEYEGMAKLLCEKNRNGPTGACWFSWQPSQFRFRELDTTAWPDRQRAGTDSGVDEAGARQWKPWT
jgi:replicative DNA helicase